MIQQLGILIQMITPITFGFIFGIIYHHLSIVVIGLFISFLVVLMSRKWQTIAISVLLLASLGVGSYRLSEYPIRIHPDELDTYFTKISASLDTQTLLKRPESLPFLKGFYVRDSRHNSRPRMTGQITCQMYYISTKIFGKNFVGCRMSTVMIGALTVLLFFLLLRRMSGFTVAFAGASMMAFSSWHLSLSRIHLPYMATNCYVILVLYVFWVALKYPALFLPLGILVGYSISSYSSIKVIYYFIPVYMVYAFIFKKWRRRNIIIGMMVLVIVVFSVLSIQGDSWKSFFGCAQSGSNLTPTLEGWKNTILEVFKIDWTRYTTFSRRNYIELGLRFAPWVVIMSIIGILACTNKIGKRESIFLLMWIIFAISPDAMSLPRHVSRRATQVIAPMMALACYPLILVPRGNIRRALMIVLIIISLYGAYIGYFQMYDNVLNKPNAWRKPYTKIQAEKVIDISIW